MIPSDTLSQSAATSRPGRATRLRAAVALGAVSLAFVGLTGRLAHLQIVRADHYSAMAIEQQVVSRRLSARRGDVLDASGRRLASSVRVWSVFADPSQLRDLGTTADALARTLELDSDRLLTRFRARPKSRFAWVKRQITPSEARAVRKLALHGVHMRREYDRSYPHGTRAAHVIGFTDIDGRGLAGIELQMDALLRGRAGMELARCDGGRRAMQTSAAGVRRDPFNGHDVQLTLDLQVQIIAEQELDEAFEKHAPESAMVVVLDVQSGAVLAMASLPGYAPESAGDFPPEARRNMSVTDAYEFGSVMKPFTIALALDAGTVTPETVFDCHGGNWRVTAGRTLHDAHEYGPLSVFEILVHSSNIGAAQIAMRLGLQPLHDGIVSFGFATRSEIALPGEIGGIVHDARYWNDPHSVISVSFGQEIAVTPLAVTRAFAALANEGVLPEPHVVRGIVHTGTGQTVYTAAERPGRRVVSADAARAVMAMLHQVVERGTGKRAQIKGYTVGGKTGTAQLPNPAARGYADGKYLSSFVAVAPVEQSRIAVLVALKAPTKGGHYGGTVAAPAVRNIVERTLMHLRVPRSNVSNENE
jgi:cell division protein FtsI (penicillin-binding protein 3)